MSLKDLTTYIQTHQKLPKMPSEQEVVQEGMDLKQLNTLLVEKVEELTLYTLQLYEENEKPKAQNKRWERRFQTWEERLRKLEQK